MAEGAARQPYQPQSRQLHDLRQFPTDLGVRFAPSYNECMSQEIAETWSDGMIPPEVTATSTARLRRIELHRKVAIVTPDVIEIRPSRRTLVPALIGFVSGLGAITLLGAGRHWLPLAVMAILLFYAVLAVPLSGLSFVYGLIGANVVISRPKQSATWQQGFSGMGIGTKDLVPFWKIAAIHVEEAGTVTPSEGRRVEEFAQWQVVLEKTSGKRLTIAGATAHRSLSSEAQARATEVAALIAGLCGAPLNPTGESSDEAGSDATSDHAIPVAKRPVSTPPAHRKRRSGHGRR